MDITRNSDRRNRIIGLSYVFNSEATVNDYPGKGIQVLVIEWIPIKFTTASFVESDDTNGEFVVQELTIIMSGTSEDIEKQIRNLTGKEVLVKLDYSSGLKKVVGTEHNPVLFAASSTGSPVQQTLTTKRNSAEKSKLLLS